MSKTKLVSTFLNDEGKKHSWTFNDPDTSKSPEEIKEALELLTTLDLFEKNGVTLFQKVVQAKYVETIETPIFEGDELFDTAMMMAEIPKEETSKEETSKEEVPTEPEESEADKIARLKASSTWREMPQVPTVNLSSLLNNEEVHIDAPLETTGDNFQPIAPEVRESTNKAISDPTKEEPDPPDTGYNLVKEMFKRKLRRKAKEQRRQSPPDSSG